MRNRYIKDNDSELIQSDLTFRPQTQERMKCINIKTRTVNRVNSSFQTGGHSSTPIENAVKAVLPLFFMFSEHSVYSSNGNTYPVSYFKHIHIYQRLPNIV